MRAAWLGLIFLTSLVPGPVGSILQFFAMLLGGLVFAIFGIVMVIASLCEAICLWPDKRRALGVGLGAPAIVTATILLSIPTLVIGNWTFAWGTVFLGRGWMTSVIAEAQKRPASGGDEIVGDGRIIPYWVDNRGPVRVVFVTNPGFLDNWSGIVFDPTHRVNWRMAGMSQENFSRQKMSPNCLAVIW